MCIDLFVHSASQLLTMPGGPQRSSALGTLGLIEDGAVAIHAGKIIATGTTTSLRGRFEPRHEIDATGKVVLPGFVDPHTHAVWAGDRVDEFEMRIAGATYLEIMRAGGGIMATVRQTRAASVQQLVDQTRARLQRMLAHGTTTVEVKTGYGLDTAAELRQWAALARLQTEGPWDIVPTFLGAHAVPTEYAGRDDAYVDVVVNEMLPAVREQGVAMPGPVFCDVFCDDGAFTVAQARRVLEQARTLGFGVKIHADEFAHVGATALAVALGAVSADHVVRTSAEDISALGQSKTIAVSLPCTPFGLGQNDYTPARALLAANGLLALATDCNPGTAWCESMPFVVALACRYLHLTPAQAVAAATINAAYAAGVGDRVGSVEVGKQADVLVLDIPDYRHVGYRFGTNVVRTVVKAGRIVVETGQGGVL
ncbi:MAG: imidazolonepropionase [Deltaproteobacteria bacterium]|nr:imidazolonepropionase [Deltaproteobacteria bacterium]